jgi:hypothetical protein
MNNENNEGVFMDGSPVTEETTTTKQDLPNRVGIKVTAVDFNGDSFDGVPLVPVGITQEVFGNLLATDQITIKRHTSTDYALWNVKTKEGTILVAGPGDFIEVLECGSLRVFMDPGSDYN